MSRKITPEIYEKLVNAYRELGVNHRIVSESIGCIHYVTARKLYQHGLPSQNMDPIRKVLAEEKIAARAGRVRRRIQIMTSRSKMDAEAHIRKAQEQAQEILKASKEEADAYVAKRMSEVEAEANKHMVETLETLKDKNAARIDAMEQQSDEALLCRISRQNVLAAQAFINVSWKNAKVLATVITEAVQNGELNAKQALAFSKDLIHSTKEVNEATKLALQMDRLRTGDPTDIVRVDSEPLNIEEAARDIQHIANQFELAKRRGLLKSAPKVIEIPAEETNKDPPASGD